MSGIKIIGIVLIFVEIVYADIVGYVKVSDEVEKLYDFENVGIIETLENFEICIGKVKNDNMRVVHHCVTSVLQRKEESSEKFHETDTFTLPIGDSKISTHLLLIPRKIKLNHFDDDASMTDSDDIFSSPLPLMFPNEESQHILEPIPGLTLKISLECVENHYGPRCETYCNSSAFREGLTCDQQTGEIVCAYGWIGDDCSEYVFIDQKTASEFIKSRFKREEIDNEYDCNRIPCTDEQLQDFLLSGSELTEEKLNQQNECMVKAGCQTNHTLLCTKINDEEKCVCKTGYKGDNCSEIDLCFSEPCHNGGFCEKKEDGIVCTCPDGFHGNLCENEINHCLDEVCSYHGECESDSTGFRCDCDNGFTGEKCEIDIDDCEEYSCSLNGKCVDGLNSYDCDCNEGFTGKHCETLIDACRSEPCLNGAKCLSFPDGTFECECTEDYFGMTCENENHDPCSDDPCHSRGKCYSVLEDEEIEKKALCECEVGYIGKYCETEVTPCESVEMPCPTNATCVNLENEYMCVCPSGFEGENCEISCDPCEERNDLKCEENPCKNDARCMVLNNNSTCICGIGFTGDHCEIEVDYCANITCGNQGECILMRDGYQCNCDEGFTGVNCEEDINECEVELGLCKNEGECINIYGGFKCTCAKGFAGETCDHKLDACSFNNKCLNGGTCITSEESFVCACRLGYVGLFCEEVVDLCADVPSPCQNNGTCEVVSLEEQTIKCNCHERYYGRYCEEEIPACKVKYELGDGSHELTDRTDCGSYGDCVIDDVKGFVCKCHKGYQGELCDQRINIVECKDIVCECESVIRNFKALHNKFDNNTECVHPIYGKGRCGREECLSANCKDASPLICQYEAKCFDKNIPTPRSSRDTNSCPILHLNFDRQRIPPGSTVTAICEKIRRTKPLKTLSKEVAVKCVKDSLTSNELHLATAIKNTNNEANYDVHEIAEKLFEYLKDVVLNEKMDHDISPIFTALQNASFNGELIIAGFPANNVTDYPVDKKPFNQRAKDAAIIAVAVVCSVVLLVLAMTFIICLQKRKSFQRTQSPIPHNHDNNNVEIDAVHFTKNGKIPNDSKLMSFDNPLINGVDNNVFTLDENPQPSPSTSRIQQRIRESDDTEDTASRTGVSTFVKNSPKNDVSR